MALLQKGINDRHMSLDVMARLHRTKMKNIMNCLHLSDIRRIFGYLQHGILGLALYLKVRPQWYQQW